LFIVAWITIEAIQRLMNPQAVDAMTVIWIGTLGFVVNLVVFALLRRGDGHDMNVAAATLHVFSDLLGSLAAIVAATIIVFTGWMLADPISSLLVSVLILRGAWSLVRKSTHILMEGAPEGVDVDDLRRTLEERIPAIVDVHHVHLWLVGPHEKLMTMHATVSPGANQAHVLRETKAILETRFGITHTTIQIEVEGCADEDCVKPTDPARGIG
jgi:cobalt-zinc-cadmium efflux system protein